MFKIELERKEGEDGREGEEGEGREYKREGSTCCLDPLTCGKIRIELALVTVLTTQIARHYRRKLLPGEIRSGRE